MTLLRSSLSSLFLVAVASAEIATFTTPTLVTGDADGNMSAPWVSDGVTVLELQFDTSATIPDGATINSVVVRTSGNAISPSYRSETFFRVEVSEN